MLTRDELEQYLKNKNVSQEEIKEIVDLYNKNDIKAYARVLQIQEDLKPTTPNEKES